MFKVAWCPAYALPLPQKHRFPMEKYELLPNQLLLEGIISETDFFSSQMVSEEAILEVHDSIYWEKLKTLSLSRSEIRRTGFPLSQQLVDRERIIAQGTIHCAEYALQYGVSMNIAGGTHHAYTDRGEGFCLLNDIGIAASHLKKLHRFQRILVVDLDVHQGNGTAQMFKNDNEVFTFSMHGEKNYPLHKEESDLDIGLPDGTEDEQYLNSLSENLENLKEQFDPQFVFYQSGVDVLKTDKLGRLSLTLAGCKRRDEMVLSMCSGFEIPVVAVMGGGYSEDISVIVDAHVNTFRLARDLFF